MFRGVIIGYGLLSLIGAAVLLFIVHARLWLVVYLAVNGVILVSAVLLERQRPRVAQRDSSHGGKAPYCLQCDLCKQLAELKL